MKGSLVLQPRPDESGRFGLVPVRSPLLRQSLLLSFPGGNEMFQFPPFATLRLWIQRRSVREPRYRRSFNSSAGLIAVFHALLRLLAPRHPPHALSSLTALILSSARVATSREAGCKLPVRRFPVGRSNDPYFSQGSCRDHKNNWRCL
jgi:hypothetical protein